MKLDLLKRMKSPYFWVWTLLAISVIFGVLFRIFDEHWLYVATFIPWIPITLFFAVAMVFAWIINPIRALIQRRKEKKK